jgi:hypothetical protein
VLEKPKMYQHSYVCRTGIQDKAGEVNSRKACIMNEKPHRWILKGLHKLLTKWRKKCFISLKGGGGERQLEEDLYPSFWTLLAL